MVYTTTFPTLIAFVASSPPSSFRKLFGKLPGLPTWRAKHTQCILGSKMAATLKGVVLLKCQSFFTRVWVIQNSVAPNQKAAFQQFVRCLRFAFKNKNQKHNNTNNNNNNNNRRICLFLFLAEKSASNSGALIRSSIKTFVKFWSILMQEFPPKINKKTQTYKGILERTVQTDLSESFVGLFLPHICGNQILDIPLAFSPFFFGT